MCEENNWSFLVFFFFCGNVCVWRSSGQQHVCDQSGTWMKSLWPQRGKPKLQTLAMSEQQGQVWGVTEVSPKSHFSFQLCERDDSEWRQSLEDETKCRAHFKQAERDLRAHTAGECSRCWALGLPLVSSPLPAATIPGSFWPHLKTFILVPWWNFCFAAQLQKIQFNRMIWIWKQRWYFAPNSGTIP